MANHSCGPLPRPAHSRHYSVRWRKTKPKESRTTGREMPPMGMFARPLALQPRQSSLARPQTQPQTPLPVGILVSSVLFLSPRGLLPTSRMDGSGCRRPRFDAASLQVPLSVWRSEGLEATHVELRLFLFCVGLRCEVVSPSFNELQRWGDSCELRSPGPCRVRAWPRRALPL